MSESLSADRLAFEFRQFDANAPDFRQNCARSIAYRYANDVDFAGVHETRELAIAAYGVNVIDTCAKHELHDQREYALAVFLECCRKSAPRKRNARNRKPPHKPA